MENCEWIHLLNLSVKQEADLRIINQILNTESNFKLLPHILTMISGKMSEFENNCKKENDGKMREALGDAVHLLGMKKKPSIKEMAENYCIRIRKVLFPNGKTDHHHQGEKNFFDKMGW